MVDEELRESLRPSLRPRVDAEEEMPAGPPPAARALGLLRYLEDAAGVDDHRSVIEAAERAEGAKAARVNPGENFIKLREDVRRAAAAAAGGADSDLEDVESGSEDGEMTTSERVKYPWMESRGATERCASTSSPFVRLHIEIVEFVRLMSPTAEEVRQRTEATASVAEVVRSIWADAAVEIFGSFKTGLYLPSSDVDLVIIHSGCRNEADGLRALAIALSRRGLARNIQVIAQARVPIVKFEEPRSGVQFDVTFDRANGPAAAEFVAREVARFPALKPLCLVLKIFLQQRELNEVYTGGIGSYGLLIMIIAHIQTSALYPAGAGREHNLGQLLYNFFDLYGRKLNVSEIGVSCGGGKAGGAHFFSKRARNWFQEKRPNLISLEDPQDAENDVGKNSYNFSQLRIAFEYAHQLLTAALLDPKDGRSVLGAILRPDKLLRRRSQLVLDAAGPGAADGRARGGAAGGEGAAAGGAARTAEEKKRGRREEGDGGGDEPGDGQRGTAAKKARRRSGGSRGPAAKPGKTKKARDAFVSEKRKARLAEKAAKREE